MGNRLQIKKKKENEFRQQLQEYYKAPAPERKHLFLREYAPHRTSPGYILRMQIHYISKVTWICSAAIFALAMLLSYLSAGGDIGGGVELYIGSIYGLAPFLVMLAITECMKSARYGMQELEQAALFSMQSIMMARMVILGIGNLVVLVAMALVAGADVPRQFLYLLVPYLLTAVLGLEIMRRFRGTEGVYLCFGASVIVAAVQMTVQMQWNFIYEERYGFVWLCAAAAAALVTGHKGRQMIQMKEDVVWN